MSWIQFLFIMLNLFSFVILKTSTMQNKQYFLLKRNMALQKVVSAITSVKNQYQIRSKEMPNSNVWIADPWTSNRSDEKVKE